MARNETFEADVERLVYEMRVRDEAMRRYAARQEPDECDWLRAAERLSLAEGCFRPEDLAREMGATRERADEVIDGFVEADLLMPMVINGREVPRAQRRFAALLRDATLSAYCKAARS